MTVETRCSIDMKTNPVYGDHTAAEPVQIESNPVYGVQTHQQSEDDTYYNICDWW